MKVLVAVNPFLTDTTGCEGFEFVVNPWGGDPTPERIEAELSHDEYSGLLVGTKKVKNSIADLCPTLKTIARVGAGVDNVDVEYFKHRGIITTNTPNGPTDSTAEQAMSLMLSALRKIPFYSEQMKVGQWKRVMGKRLKDCTVGVVGIGRIGKTVTKLLLPFGCEVMLNDVNIDVAFANEHGLKYQSKEQILRCCDIITFHCSLSKDTINWLSADDMALLKTDAIIVNAARGGIVNENDMCDFLKANQGSMYCADTFEQEPYCGKLSELTNTILTPHVSTFTYGARAETERQALENCLDVLMGKQSRYKL